MNNLRLAIEARLPLIAVQTDDPLNVELVLKQHTDREVHPLGKFQHKGVSGAAFPVGTTCYTVGDLSETDAALMFKRAAAAETTLIVVNPSAVTSSMFNAGTITLPDSVITEFVAEYCDDEDLHYSLEAALRGLTFKELVEVAKMAMAESGAFTPDAVLKVRRRLTVLSSGLQLVNTEQHDFYAPQAELLKWLKVEGPLFKMDLPQRLRPRGLLFSGEPGTGKTSGAKFLAHTLGVPLYLLDVGSTMQKYVGESERTFANALAQVETLAPCVMLLDEVEKAFDTGDDSGVSRRVLGMLLWWLQEHTAKVLTVMTTNDSVALPRELIRPGRIDAEIEFQGLDHSDAVVFAERLRLDLTNVAEVPDHAVELRVNRVYATDRRRSHAEITQLVIRLVKARLAASRKE